MSDPQHDRNLLFGILALQMDFVTRDALVAAMNAWVLAKERPLGQILVEQNGLRQANHNLLAPLVEAHIRQHDNDPEQSLASLNFLSSLSDELRRIADPQLQESLAHVVSDRAAADASTMPFSVGAATSAGTRFRILRPHAEGGLGIVSVARDEELSREVALKEMRERLVGDPISRTRFVMEAEITGGLEHPNIIPIYGVGKYADGRPFYAMRFIRGDNLRDACRRFHGSAELHRDPGRRTIEFQKLLRRFLDVCNAIAYAHSRGVLHRDLKPGNIMLGKYGETLLVDWGLAKLLSRGSDAETSEAPMAPPSAGESGETMQGATVGTPAYMSPEQAAGRIDLLGPATDIYGLGATLYYLLTNRAPLTDEDTAVVLQKVQRGEFDSPRRIDAAIPPALEAICLKAMALKPEDRYPTARALAEEIEHWLADEPVAALAEPISLRTKRWMRKHPGPVAGLAASLLAGIAGLATGLLLVNAERARTEMARQGEEKQRKEAQRQGKVAEAQRAEAARQRDETEAVLQFVQNQVFSAARPENEKGGLGHDVTLARAIEAALPFVTEGFKGRPLTEARLRMTLGTSFLYLGEPLIAERQYSRARELYAVKLGPDHPDTLNSMMGLANSYAALGRNDEALALREATLKFHRAKLGPDHPVTLKSMMGLANSYFALGRHAEALALREETLKFQKTKLGPDHPDTLASMNNLASSYAALGRHADALALGKETLKLHRAKLGPDHPDTLKSMNNLANSYFYLGRHAEALALREEALKFQKTKLGPDHPDTLASMNNLATSYAALGRHAEALRLSEETLKLQKAKLGPDHPVTLRSMNNLANSYFALGRHAEALALQEETLRLTKAKLGPDHPDTLDSMNNLASSYEDVGRNSQALALREETLKLTKAKLGPDHPDTLGSMNNLASSYEDVGRNAEALALLEETLKLRKAKLGPDHPDTLSSMNNLANSYAALGRIAEALALREETLKLRMAKLGPDHPYTLRSMSSLADSYFALGRHAEALALREETLKLQKAKLGPDHPDTLKSMNNLANSYEDLGRHAEALALREETRKLRMAKLGPINPETLAAQTNLAASYRQAGREAEALPLLEDSFQRMLKVLPANHQHLFVAANQLTQCYAALGRTADSIATVDRYLRQVEGRENIRPKWISKLIGARERAAAKAHDVEACEATVQMWEKLNRTDAIGLYNAACYRAVCAAVMRDKKEDRAGEQADRAMAWLKKAVAAGYKDVEHMKRDQDLDALRDRDDFKKLFGELAARTK